MGFLPSVPHAQPPGDLLQWGQKQVSVETFENPLQLLLRVLYGQRSVEMCYATIEIWMH